MLVHLEWWQTYYSARPQESLREALAQPVGRGGIRIPQRYRQRTLAMTTWLTQRRWTMRELLTVPLASTPHGTG